MFSDLSIKAHDEYTWCWMQKRQSILWHRSNCRVLCQNVSCMMIFKSKSEGVGEETVYVMIFTCSYWQQARIPQSRESVVRCVTAAQPDLIRRNFPQSQMADESSLFKYKTTIVILKSIKVNHLMKEHSLNCDLSSWSATRLVERSKMAGISWDKRQIIKVHALCRFWTHSSRIFLTSECPYLKIIHLVHSAHTHAQKWTAKPFNTLPTGTHEWDLLSQLLKAFLWLVSWKSHLFLLSWGCQTKTFW